MNKDYLILAAGSIAVGIVLTFVVLGASVRAGVDLNEQLWLLAVPAVLSVTLNIILLELYRRFWKKK
ncbi:MAG: hypothetical protein QF432_05330 [Dehalococcoidales bacterium]|nr:hypothetical protein [Dehalococcoidales bacterium]MDP6127553.1 hypothetical protein [Dehalococcoidales bacterium]